MEIATGESPSMPLKMGEEFRGEEDIAIEVGLTVLGGPAVDAVDPGPGADPVDRAENGLVRCVKGEEVISRAEERVRPSKALVADAREEGLGATASATDGAAL